VEIDKQRSLSLASAPSRQLLQEMFRENPATEELRAAPHEIQKRVFPVWADKGYVSEINNQASTLKVLCRMSPRRFNLRCPRGHQFALEHELSLQRRIDDGNLEHYSSAFRDSLMQGLCQSLVLRKPLKPLVLKLGCGRNCREMSKSISTTVEGGDTLWAVNSV